MQFTSLLLLLAALIGFASAQWGGYGPRYGGYGGFGPRPWGPRPWGPRPTIIEKTVIIRPGHWAH